MSKIKPHQDNIELMFPDEVYLRGEELFEDGAVLEFTPIEKNLFSFVVSDGQRFEVEWLRPFTKHQRASCDCSFFKSEKVCRHVVAAILAYKATLPEKKEKPAESQQKSGLNLFTLLNNVTKEELKAFIKNYAQTDKKLSTALKVHFARKVDLHDNEKKYRSILDAIIRPVTTGSATIKISDVKSLNQVAIEFIEQAWDAIALGQYGEALILTKVTLSKLCYTLHHNYGAIAVLEKT
ncbi:MAG: SWIM zinc finger family protein [Saprospiraceae bacterium]|nr:SWIM zinc finger family protein [Saprospiraceae bacterium]